MSYIEWIREKVGQQKLFLVFATVIVTDENGRILLQRRTDFSFWGLPGGAMELHENIQTTARRELREETGLEVGALRLVGVYTDPLYDVIYPNGDQVQQFTICFSGQMTAGRMEPDGTETIFQQFVAPVDALRRDLPPWYRQMIGDFLHCDAPAFRPPFCGQQVVDQIWSIRPFIGNERLIAVGGSSIIRNGEGEILLVKRADDQAWVLPAGYSDIGENVAHTTVREVREETGLTVEPVRIIGIFSDPHFHWTYPNGHQVQNVGVLFECRWVSGQVALDTKENSDFRWVAADELDQAMAPRLRPYAQKIMTHLNEGYFVY